MPAVLFVVTSVVKDARRLAYGRMHSQGCRFSVFSVIFGPFCSPPIRFLFCVFSISTYFIFLFLNFLSLFVFIFCETACTRRLSVIFAKVQWHPCVVKDGVCRCPTSSLKSCSRFVVPSVVKDARRLECQRMHSEGWCVQVSDKQLEEL